MTFEAHQQEALEKAYELLKEHFDASIIVVTATSIPGEPVETDATQVYWAGGVMNAIGQAEFALRKILDKNSRNVAPDERT